MTETRIYVGLNDAVTLEQRFDTGRYVSILKHVCRAYHVPFSFSVVEGGYFHENGDYTQETTLVLSLIDAPTDTVPEIARDLCAFFHQESVLVTEGAVNAYFVKDSLEAATDPQTE
ncbi:MAG: hypothetical protein IJK02_08855 [Clostridia bacterium]|nr:hypothetical protein [Clostridia bacterium]MBR0508727.1 hypothetical protein [Clostridia bacterium]MBR0537981.1 hypothetical protein [Clostridia bacterium]